MNANAERAERAKAFQRAIQWLSAPEAEGIRSAAFTHWLAESHYHLEEAIHAACIWHQIRALSAEECAKIVGPSRSLSRTPKQTAQALAAHPPKYRTKSLRHRALAGRRAGDRVSAKVDTALFPIRAHSGWYRAVVRIAAAAIAAAVFAIPVPLDKPVTLQPSDATEHQYSTEIGEHRSFTLQDGSHVDLNTGSSIATYYTSNGRTVHLFHGEALFEVIHDATRPFRVLTGNTVVEDIATKFDVYRRSGRSRITVIDGSVRIFAKAVASAGHTLVDVFTHGQQLDVSDTFTASTTPPRTIEPGELERVTAWRSGRIEFAGEPMSDVLRELARYNSVEFVITDPAIAEFRVGGSFEATDLDGFLFMLREEFEVGISVTLTPTGVRVITLTRPKRLQR